MRKKEINIVFEGEKLEALKRIKPFVEKHIVRIDKDTFNDLETVYENITRRSINKGCVECIPDAYKIIKNYLAKFPLKKEKKTEKKEEKKSDFEFPVDLDNPEKLEKEIGKKEDPESKEIVEEIKNEVEKKAPAKKKPAPKKKTTAKSTPRTRRTRK